MIKNFFKTNLILKLRNFLGLRPTIFNVNYLVSYLSKFMSLQAGDIITTGTPPGVGMGMKPQVFLKIGDKIRLSIDNLGEQNSKVIAE